MSELLVAQIKDEFFDAEKRYVLTEKMHIIGRLQGGGARGYARTNDPFHMKRLTYAEWQALEATKKTSTST